MFRLKAISLLYVVLSLLVLLVVGVVNAQDTNNAPSLDQDIMLAEQKRRRQKLEQQLDDLKLKVAAYEDGVLDIPEKTYIRYAQRMKMMMMKVDKMKHMEEGSGDSIDL